MLNAEEARARLEAIADADWRSKADRRARKVHRRLRQAAAAILAPDPAYTDRRAVAHQRERRLAVAAEIDGLLPRDRLELMAALHPQLGPALDRWWGAAARQPYTVGWARKAFRAPRAPSLTRERRIGTLRRVVEVVGPYARDATWLAAWAPYLSQAPYGDLFDAGPLLAAAVDAGGADGQAVFDTLVAVGRGDHPVGMMGRHVIVGLLRASRPDGWDFVERLLMAAQRQEGLRQSILEAADEGHPQAFDRLIALTLEHDLLRFAATLRAVGVWLGFQPDVANIPQAKHRLEQLRRYRSDPSARKAALDAGDGWETYTALCALAMIDVVDAIGAAQVVLARRPTDSRAAAIRFAEAAQLTSSEALAWSALDDEDVRVAWLAVRMIGRVQPDGAPADAFARLERLARRLPEKERSLDPIGIEHEPVAVSRPPVVAAMVRLRGRRPLTELLPWVSAMDPWTRQSLCAAIADHGPRLTPELRETVLAMVGDRSPQVRSKAVEAMGQLRVHPADAPVLEALLTRKAGDLRRGVIGLLAAMPEAEVVRAAERLWEGDTAQRDAACELLREVKERPAAVDAARRFAAASLSPAPSPGQAKVLAVLTGGPVVDAHDHADDPGLGLYDAARRAPIPTPSAPPRRRSSASSDLAARIVGALDDLAEAHRDTPLTLASWQGSREVLLADARWLPSPFNRYASALDAGAEQGAGLLLPDVFRPWWENRPAELRGPSDDIDALRALAALAVSRTDVYGARGRVQQNDWWWDLMGQIGGAPTGEVRHAAVVSHVLSWILVEAATGAVVDECLDAVAATAAGVPASAVRAIQQEDVPRTRRRWDADFRLLLNTHPWLLVLGGLYGRRPELFAAEQIRCWFHLARWFDEPKPGAARQPVDSRLAVRAFELGVATEHDLFDLLLQRSSRLLQPMTRHRRSDVVARHPDVVALADRLRQRVLDIELSRGELATPASKVAFLLGSISGAATVVRLLAGLGRATLVRGHIGSDEGRQEVYSHLLRVSHPAPDDTGASLQALAAAAGVTDQRLLELAVFAPQWAELVEVALGWPGLADGVWWFHAHTKDDQWSVAAEVRETWASLSAERTPLPAEDLVAGAVDVAWFHRSREALGTPRWVKLHRVAKLASGGSGHRRAQLFAEAMAGDIDEPALVERIRAKRHQDSVRALGLVPLPEDAADRTATMLRRYAVLREFERGASQFGSQRQASEKTAVRIGIENLARTGGSADPQRFVWAMEAAEAGALADGPVSVTGEDDAGEVTVTLSVDEEGIPGISVARNGRALKAVPPKSKKVPAVAELLARKAALTRQATRVRASLEAAMVNQDGFTAGDLSALDRHPVVAPMLSLVVFADDDGRLMRRTAGGDRFVDAGGAVVPIPTPDGVVRLAHPVDLVASGEWVAWQEQLFADERRQPFKQVFRELYLLTATERAAGPGSHRYEGHQVQPRQALALLGRRGWLADRETGEVARVFHAHGLAARLQFVDGFATAADVELPTIEGVYFTKQGSWKAENIETVPPVVFSETMRDLDLMVSVAHAGGVDPEASHSTVEMRAALVRETVRVLKLDNVREVNAHVIIEGVLGEYSVHLGSGVVHRRPGGAVCIIPVDSQRRGRLFLPFADPDPKTAEVVSKVLLLARDREIRDPSILAQLR
ncbi:MAG: hypothetical protein QOG82_1381 [Actinomycetota bacterium]|jgi:hypothetical protein|nr:hypothetical protein [Actinomycetota bacterium]